MTEFRDQVTITRLQWKLSSHMSGTILSLLHVSTHLTHKKSQEESATFNFSLVLCFIFSTCSSGPKLISYLWKKNSQVINNLLNLVTHSFSTYSFIWYCARWWGWRVCYTDRKCCPHGTYIKLKIVTKMGIWGTRSGLWLWHFLRCERRIMTFERRAQFWMCSIWLCQSNTQTIL